MRSILLYRISQIPLHLSCRRLVCDQVFDKSWGENLSETCLRESAACLLLACDLLKRWPVLSCPCRRCEHNWRQNKTVLSCLDPVSKFSVVLNIFETKQLQIGNWVDVKTELSCFVANSVHTADTNKTRQVSFILSVLAVWLGLICSIIALVYLLQIRKCSQPCAMLFFSTLEALHLCPIRHVRSEHYLSHFRQ